MQFNYVIPSTISVEDLGPVAHTSQLKTEVASTQGMMINQLNVSESADILLNKPVFRGSGGKLVYVYNFTDKPICMLDSNNNLTIIESCVEKLLSELDPRQNCIVAEVIYVNQDYELATSSKQYLSMRRAALTGLDLPEPAEYFYHDVGNFDNQYTRATTNQRFRYHIRNIDFVLTKYNGCFYIEELDLVLSSMANPSSIPLHPKSSKEVIKKARPKMDNKHSLGIEIALNDTQYLFEKAFVNISGKVLEIPIDRDTSKPDGVTIWENVHARNTGSKFYTLNSPDLSVKIYGSRLEAEAGSDPGKILEKELLTEKARLQREKQEHDRQEFERTRQRTEEQTRLQREKEERDRAWQERQEERRAKQEKANEKAENASFVRKILVEGAKAVAAIATTVVVVLGWLAKQKAKSG